MNPAQTSLAQIKFADGIFFFLFSPIHTDQLLRVAGGGSGSLAALFQRWRLTLWLIPVTGAQLAAHRCAMDGALIFA